MHGGERLSAGRIQYSQPHLAEDAGRGARVQLRRFPDDVLDELRGYSLEVVEALAAEDPMSGKVYASYRAFADEVGAWLRISEGS